jgi:hypothetical protein
MKNNSAIVLFAAALAAAVFAPAAPAQVTTTAPVVIKQPKPKLEKFKGRVLSANISSIMVQSSDNEKVVRTFQYSPELRDKMQAIIDEGGYQHGDVVTVFTDPGSNVALKIKGKPSKSQ